MTSDKVVLSLNLMQHAVNRWNEAADLLNSAAMRTFNVEITDGRAGAFALALEKYKPAPTYFLDRMLEGKAVFKDIAAVLQQAHDTYEAEDAAGAHAINSKTGEL
ncbi:hypothetical protein [Nocardia altamirensis]|uniref:hypothetical protein n=1 Tax=Nocardia altamirensis TaxID=472158 RepID=UPI000840552C|nr:hypothetical protein [Nocardia altamirensis]